MTIEKVREGDSLTVALSGRLDTTTAPELNAAMVDALDGVKDLVMDFSALTYISSAGLREIFSLKKKMDGVRGSMVIRGCNEDLMEIFDITGFVDLLNIE